MSTPFIKTPKGVEAIATRSRDLPMRLRPLLILIDGKRNLAELQAMAHQFGDVKQMVEQLVQEGFAQPLNPAGALAPADQANIPAPPGPGASAAAPVPPPSAAAHGPVTLGQAKQTASRTLLNLLGPTAESLCLRIETARTRADFIEAVKRAYAMLRELRGVEVANQFGAIVEANLPPE